jgi:hypothetical protein
MCISDDTARHGGSKGIGDNPVLINVVRRAVENWAVPDLELKLVERDVKKGRNKE